jgi:hypothetical protein
MQNKNQLLTWWFNFCFFFFFWTESAFTEHCVQNQPGLQLGKFRRGYHSLTVEVGEPLDFEGGACVAAEGGGGNGRATGLKPLLN